MDMNVIKISVLACFIFLVNNYMQAQEPCWFTKPPTCRNSNFVYAAGIGTGNAERIRNLAEADALRRYVAEVMGVQLPDATYKEIVEKGLENAKIEGTPVQYRVVRQKFENNNYYILLLLPRRFSTDPRNIIYPEEELCDPLTGIRKTAEPTKIGESYSVKVSAEKPSDFEFVTSADGNLTLSLESFAEKTYFALYNEDGVSFIPTSQGIISGKEYSVVPPRGAFDRNDKVKQCTWNSTAEKFKGSFTFKLDAGTYYLRVIRGQTGLSTVNLSVQFKALR
jgi:hypothetical protein